MDRIYARNDERGVCTMKFVMKMDGWEWRVTVVMNGRYFWVIRECLMKSGMNGEPPWVMLGMFDEIRDGNERFGTEEGAWELW